MQACASGNSIQLAQRGPASQQPPRQLLADAYVAVHVPGLPPIGFPVRLQPGAPYAMKLVPGHPFSGLTEEQLCNTLTQVSPKPQSECIACWRQLE